VQNTKLTAALQLAKQGHKVFPLVPDGKTPLLSGSWREHACDNPEQIKQWWGANPNANIGMTMEKYVALDIDPRNGGDQSLQLLTMLYDMPRTRRHVTWSSGAHILYRQPEGVQIGCPKNHGLGAGIDVKGLGGYLVAPGSTIDGKPYWVANPDREFAELPQDLVDLCGQFTAKSESAGKRLVEEDDTAIALAEQWLRGRAPDAVEGQRNNTAFSVAAKLYDFGVSRDTCREMLVDWSYRHAQPPMDPEDIDLVSRSAETNRSKAIGCSHPLAPGFEAGDDGIRIKEGGSSESGAAEQTNKRGLFYVHADEAAGLALIRATQPLVEGLLDCGTLSVVYGKPGSGKSFFALDTSYHVAAGLEWNGRKTRQGVVVYIAAEGGAGIYKRFAALRQRYNNMDVPLYLVPCPVNLLRGDADLPKLLEMIRQIEKESGQPVVMIVIDTLSRALAGGDENSSVDMGAFVRNVDRLRTESKSHLTIVHHTGKNESKGARGWSGLLAAVDTEIEIGKGTMKVTKQRDGDDNLELRFRLVTVDLGADSRGNQIRSCVVEWLTGTAHGFEPIQMTKLEQQTYDALLARVKPLAEEAGVEVDQYRFGWQFLQKVMTEVPGLVDKTTSKEVTGGGASEATARRRLSLMCKVKCMTKLEDNQYVIGDLSLK
jgi:hypothetical protein